ncbi:MULTISPECIES: hypothetical protein [Saccharothrix]|uniref:hypothetical protein n=1 Tax=Saccharothrix TaxID=2071 RepID=UPI00116144BE|nr:hypothetical protein [Saccharothrix sp. CB00851]
MDVHYLDGTWVGRHRGAHFVGNPTWTTINLRTRAELQRTRHLAASSWLASQSIPTAGTT